MKGYIDNIEEATKKNKDFRHVVFTGAKCQLVLMTLQKGEEIGQEVHPHVDQFFRIEEGQAKVIIDGEEREVKDDFAIIVPAGSEHNIINTGNDKLKLYTIYSPPNHPANTVHKNKTEADEYEKEHHHEG